MKATPVIVAVGLMLAACDGDRMVSAKTDPMPSAPESRSNLQKSKLILAFAVKDPDEPWFIRELDAAHDAADQDGFDLLTYGISTPSQVVPAIVKAANAGAKGLVICSPDVRLGPEIVECAKSHGLKLIAVDDQLVDKTGKPLRVPYVGIDAKRIGRLAGKAMWTECRSRKWDLTFTRLMLLTDDSLKTAKDRTDGVVQELARDGFPLKSIIRTPIAATDVAGGTAAASVVLGKNIGVRTWLIAGMNDSVVLGAVRATEVARIGPQRVIGVGINGDSALYDLKKPEPTGLYGSVLLQAKIHGHDTADMMFRWITTGKQPPMETHTEGILITRANYRRVIGPHGI